MKKLCLLFSLCPVFLWGQVEMNFENGLPAGLEQFPAGRWGVSNQSPIEGLQSLRHVFDNTESATDFIFFPLKEPDPDSLFECSFMIRYENIPSGSNKWCFYILSEGDADSFSPGKDNTALLLGVNQTGTDDSLWIYFQDDGKISKLLNCNLNCEKAMGILPWQFRIRMEENKILVVEGGAYPGEISELARLDNWQISEIQTGFGGLGYSYTSSRDRLLTLDMIRYQYSISIDSIPPSLVNIRVFSPNSIEMEFDEDLYAEDNDNFMIYCSQPLYTFRISGNYLYIEFEAAPPNDQEINIEIQGLTDKSSNIFFCNTNFLFYYPSWHDILFSEIMANPSPGVYLPEKEYLEIYNRSRHPINLKDWKLFIGSREWLLPGFIFEPGTYHFLCHGNSYHHYSDTLTFSPVFSSSSVLPNEELKLALYTPEMVVIDALEYSVSWYNDEFKSGGGWSLERTDMNNLCGGKEIWKHSMDFSGGTPGRENSVNEIFIDKDPPKVQQVIFESDSKYLLRFNEVLDIDTFDETRQKILSENEAVLSIGFPEPFFKECRIELDSQVINREFIFQNVWKDCSGNISGVPEKLILSSPENISAADILISEVLFSPWPGCPEFIELYNNSEKVFSLYDLKVSVSGSTEPAEGGKFISGENILFYPGMYLVLSRIPSALQIFYDIPEGTAMLQIKDLPALNDAGARISLLDRGNMLIDEFVYSPGIHFPLLTEIHGVSLERLSMDGAFGSSANWHSASSLAGFATPGYQNSQFIRTGNREDAFEVEDKLFTPNNDGDKDIAILRIKLEKEGYVAMIRVFDACGRLRKILGDNELLGTNNIMFWDGRDNDGVLCESGIYLLHCEAYHLSGGRKVFKESVVLGRR